MSHRYKIRLATEHDLESLVILERRAFTTDLFTRDQIEYFLTESRATNLVIENKSQIAGAACMLWRSNNNSGRLYNLAVDPDFQGQKLGQRLMHECELEAARRSCSRVTLEVREDNKGGIRFYERLGYRILRTMPDYYHDGTPGLKMSKEISLTVPDSLKLNVPYYYQTLDFTCGPACLMMALKYFNPDFEFHRALEMMLWKEATLIFMASGFGGTDSYGMALAALKRDLKVHMVASMDTPPLLKSVRIPVKQEVMRIVHNDLKRQARQAGLTTAFFDYGIEEIMSALYRGRLPIVMISTYRLTGDKVPHWVIVTGFDRDHVFIHDPDIASYKRNRSRARNLKIAKEEFLRMTKFGKEFYRCLLLLRK